MEDGQVDVAHHQSHGDDTQHDVDVLNAVGIHFGGKPEERDAGYEALPRRHEKKSQKKKKKHFKHSRPTTRQRSHLATKDNAIGMTDIVRPPIR